MHALHGFADFLGRFLAQSEATEVAVAFDTSLTSSFRNEIYPAYKANRDLPPEDLDLQMRRCRELVDRAGIAAVASATYEADDLIGTLGAQAAARGQDVVILSGDKDLAQLLRGRDYLWDFARNRRVGVDQVPEWLGVGAHQVADRLAITGDSVDNIPGVPGIGPKGAGALLAHFGSLQTLYARLDEVAELPVRGAARMRRLLEEHRETVELARRLTGIVCDAPLEIDPRSLRIETADRAALGDWCADAGIGRAVRERLLRELSKRTSDD